MTKISEKAEPLIFSTNEKKTERNQIIGVRKMIECYIKIEYKDSNHKKNHYVQNHLCFFYVQKTFKIALMKKFSIIWKT